VFKIFFEREHVESWEKVFTRTRRRGRRSSWRKKIKVLFKRGWQKAQKARIPENSHFLDQKFYVTDLAYHLRVSRLRIA
jgi:hypothetical protein